MFLKPGPRESVQFGCIHGGIKARENFKFKILPGFFFFRKRMERDG